MASGFRASARGSFVSDGNARDVKVPGFKPAKVELYGSQGDVAVWLDGMPDAYMHKRTAAGTGTLATSGGVTPLSGGFTIGVDSDINNSTETIYWYAEE